ncbi:hypothetical protein ES708_30030 [subsurface metagenome]
MNNFAVLTIDYFHAPDSAIITNTTDNPCHLTCYYTDIKPLRHKTSLTRRGLTLPWGAYFCFVAWKSVEQMEPGDTLTHTFPFPDWSYCQTLWLAFRGTVAGTLSPSTSPVFEHHHPGQQLFCNLGFEAYPTTPGIPPCWEDFSSYPDPTKFERDTVYVQEGLYSCKLIGVNYPIYTKLKQTRPAAYYAGKTLKFTINWYAWQFCYYLLHFEATGEHPWRYTSAGGTSPGWRTKTFTHAIDPNADEITIDFGNRNPAGESTAISWDNISIEEV